MGFYSNINADIADIIIDKISDKLWESYHIVKDKQKCTDESGTILLYIENKFVWGNDDVKCVRFPIAPFIESLNNNNVNLIDDVAKIQLDCTYLNKADYFDLHIELRDNKYIYMMVDTTNNTVLNHKELEEKYFKN